MKAGLKEREEALAEVNNAKAYAQSAWTIFHENRSPQFPYIIENDVETGPLLFLCGHAFEICCKAALRASGTENGKLISFKGFRYEDGQRYKKAEPRRHCISFLFRAVHLLTLAKAERLSLYSSLVTHTYWNEKHEFRLDPAERPTTSQLRYHLALLDQGFDRPYAYRYAQLGIQRLPSAEFLLVAVDFLNDISTNRLSSSSATNT